MKNIKTIHQNKMSSLLFNNNQNVLKEYNGSYFNAFNVFGLSLIVWYLTDYNLFPLIIGLNSLNYHLHPTRTSRNVDLISNIFVTLYVAICLGGYLCLLFTFILIRFYFKNLMTSHIIDDIEIMNKRHRLFVQIPAMIALYCGIKRI